MTKLKLIVVGGITTGNEYLAEFLCTHKKGEAPQDYTPTIVEEYSKFLTVNNEQVELEVHDASPSIGYRHTSNFNMQQLHPDACMLVFSFDRPNTIHAAQRIYENRIRPLDPYLPVILVGVRSEHRERVVNETVQRVSQAINPQDYVTCSVQTGENVNAAFIRAAEFALVHSKQKAAGVEVGDGNSVSSNSSCSSDCLSDSGDEWGDKIASTRGGNVHHF